MRRNTNAARKAARSVVGGVSFASILFLVGCSSPAQTFRDTAPAFGFSFDIASDEVIDLYGATACDGGREALGRLLSAESDDDVDVIYALATSAYCPD